MLPWAGGEGSLERAGVLLMALVAPAVLTSLVAPAAPQAMLWKHQRSVSSVPASRVE